MPAAGGITDGGKRELGGVGILLGRSCSGCVSADIMAPIRRQWFPELLSVSLRVVLQLCKNAEGDMSRLATRSYRLRHLGFGLGTPSGKRSSTESLRVNDEGMNGLVLLRAVQADDLPVFFAHQLDPEATHLAAFPSRDREAFMTHWTTHIIGHPTNTSRTILFGDSVVGHVGSWSDPETGERSLGYWIGREFWGRGIASAAVAQFLQFESTRPLT